MKAKSVWLYQCNPEPQREDAYYYTPDLLQKACKKGRYLHTGWYCPQHSNDIQVGDVLILYFAGKDGGIYGIGSITRVHAAGRKNSTISHRLNKRVTDHLIRNPIPVRAVYALGFIKNQRHTVHDVTEPWQRLIATLSIISSIFP